MKKNVPKKKNHKNFEAFNMFLMRPQYQAIMESMRWSLWMAHLKNFKFRCYILNHILLVSSWSDWAIQHSTHLRVEIVSCTLHTSQISFIRILPQDKLLCIPQQYMETNHMIHHITCVFMNYLSWLTVVKLVVFFHYFVNVSLS